MRELQMPAPDPLLSVTGLVAGYGATEILRGVDLAVQEDEIVAVLGANGAGKSTLNRVLSGVLRAWRGSIRFADAAIERAPPAEIVRRGLIHVPEGRRIFPNMTVRENIDLGAFRRARARRAAEPRARIRDLPAPRRAPVASAPARCRAASSRCWRSAAA